MLKRESKVIPHRRNRHSLPWNPNVLCATRLYEPSFHISPLGILTLCAVPPTASWLTEKEKAFIQARLPGNAPRATEANFKFREILMILKDKTIWLFTLCWVFFTVGTTGLAFYQPTVIANLGFT